MVGNNTTVVESTGRSSEIQGHYEKYEKFVVGGFFVPSLLPMSDEKGMAERGDMGEIWPLRGANPRGAKREAKVWVKEKEVKKRKWNTKSLKKLVASATTK